MLRLVLPARSLPVRIWSDSNETWDEVMRGTAIWNAGRPGAFSQTPIREDADALVIRGTETYVDMRAVPMILHLAPGGPVRHELGHLLGLGDSGPESLRSGGHIGYRVITPEDPEWEPSMMDYCRPYPDHLTDADVRDLRTLYPLAGGTVLPGVARG